MCGRSRSRANFIYLSEGRPVVLGRPSLDPEGGSHGPRHINIAGPLVTPGPAPVVLRALQDAVRVRARLMRLPPEAGRLMTTDWISPFGRALARLDEVEADLALWADRAAADVIAEEVHAARAAISEGLGAVAVALNHRNERSESDA